MNHQLSEQAKLFTANPKLSTNNIDPRLDARPVILFESLLRHKYSAGQN